MSRRGSVRLRNGKYRRVEIVSKINAYRPDRGLVTYAGADRVRHIVEVAARSWTAEVATRLWIVLVIFEEGRHDSTVFGENIAHVVEEHEAHVLLHPRQGGRWESKFEIVDPH